MESQRFDQLSRRLAGFGSRRQALKALTTAVVASIAGARTTSGQSCTATYRPCQSDGQCCAGAVCQSGICQPGCRIDGVFRSASTPQPGNTCAKCDPAKSTSSWSPANPGMACSSGNLCGGRSTCQNGTCQPTNPTVCQPLTPCHAAGECNPATGLCSNPPAEAGIPCGGSEMCIGGFHTPALTCNGNGACTAGPTVPCTPYICGPTTCLTACSDHSHCAPGHTCCAGACTGESTAPCSPYACTPDACLTACSTDAHCAAGFSCCDGACIRIVNQEPGASSGGCCPVDTLTCVDPVTALGTCCAAPEGPCARSICNPDGSCGLEYLTGVCGAAVVETCSPAPVCTGNSIECPPAESACTGGERCRDGVCTICPLVTLAEPGCFWQNCFSFGGACCFVHVDAVTTQEACRGIDSCSPGGGSVDGGCYKWANSSDDQIAPPW